MENSFKNNFHCNLKLSLCAARGVSNSAAIFAKNIHVSVGARPNFGQSGAFNFNISGFSNLQQSVYGNYSKYYHFLKSQNSF